ncbi:hypothetical protein [Oceanobacillus chungangensis]|uniref:Uncharacterized protein n=1 Tax=Oceanobacillus chungangensis TaxID=1229152 RepID=A0A3D8PHR4_9BACI|nr:hypothetical protein [Oceanobacillus chungangensis]RDW15633.1 hypothetical protein CWR45_17830 [Oceanobacillus chungangensis]
MTQKMIDDLLEVITFWLADIKDIQANSYHIDALFTDLQSRADDIHIGITGLEKDIQQIDERLASILSCVLENNNNKKIAQKAI